MREGKRKREPVKNGRYRWTRGVYLPLIIPANFLPHSPISQFFKMRPLLGPAVVILLASLQAYAWTEYYTLFITNTVNSVPLFSG
jgi:hypothetical protein